MVWMRYTKNEINHWLVLMRAFVMSITACVKMPIVFSLDVPWSHTPFVEIRHFHMQTNIGWVHGTYSIRS